MEKKICGIFLKTDRLTIRPVQHSDFETWCNAYRKQRKPENLFDTMRISKDSLFQTNFENFADNIKAGIKNDKDYRLFIFLNDSGELIGTVAANDISRGIFQNSYIGYALLNNYWGCGFATEALRVFIPYCFDRLRLHRLEAGIEEDNISSIRLVSKLGFRYEGRSERRLFLRNEWQDMLVYALTREEYENN